MATATKTYAEVCVSDSTNTRNIVLTNAVLVRAVNAVLVAIGDRGFRTFDVIRVEVESDFVRFVATDGRRMAIHSLPAKVTCEPFAFHISRDVAKKIAKIHRSASLASIAVTYPNNAAVSIAYKDGRKRSRSLSYGLNEVRFPKWRGPYDSAVDGINGNCGGMLSGKAEQLASVFAPVVAIQIQANGRLLRGLEFNECRATVKSSGDFTVAVDPDLIREWLESLRDETEVTLRVRDAHSALWAVAGPFDEFICMPMDINR